ncbi:acyltransferase family protein [Priestia endophytica]|uniref:acyltransferase family protein n=1 Tax=Priestia endophytica TaxID=135735 RepID=UPI000DCA7DC7|nr:acyltransferase family protein [Priestia endophytica]RAS74271.1 acyltransferase [Priestia endophytica]
MSTGQTNKRTAYFDNAKFVLIFLVVFGHTISPYRTETSELLSVYHFIFIFHMPVFILLAGYFSKNFHKKGYYKKTFTKVLLPYLIFQTVYTFFYNFIYGVDTYSVDYYLVPRWAMWFLLSLVFWKLMLPYFAKLKPSIGMTVSILLGLLVGLFNFYDGIEDFLSISRMLVFFPFFLLGYYLSQRENPFGLLVTPVGRVLSVVILLCTLIGSYYFLNDTQYTEMLYGTKMYDSFSDFYIRIAHYVIAFIVSFAFMALIPSKRSIFTGIGQRSLYVYLLHGFFLKWFFTTDFAQTMQTVSDFAFLTLLSIAITLLTGSKLVDIVLSKIKGMKRLFRPKNVTASSK